jgi:hypothetical protein
MWFQAVSDIAAKAHWRLIILGKDSCMANTYPSGSGPSPALFSVCEQWQGYAIRRIKRIDPDLVIITQEVQSGPGDRPYTVAQWQLGLEETFAKIASPHTRVVVLGNIPRADQDPPDCLAQHPTQVQLCSGHLPSYLTPYQRAEHNATTGEGGRYIDVTPWFCSRTCSAVIGHYQVYLDGLHVTETYSLFLERVLAESLQPSMVP